MCRHGHRYRGAIRPGAGRGHRSGPSRRRCLRIEVRSHAGSHRSHRPGTSGRGTGASGARANRRVHRWRLSSRRGSPQRGPRRRYRPDSRDLDACLRRRRRRHRIDSRGPVPVSPVDGGQGPARLRRGLARRACQAIPRTRRTSGLLGTRTLARRPVRTAGRRLGRAAPEQHTSPAHVRLFDWSTASTHGDTASRLACRPVLSDGASGSRMGPGDISCSRMRRRVSCGPDGSHHCDRVAGHRHGHAIGAGRRRCRRIWRFSGDDSRPPWSLHARAGPGVERQPHDDLCEAGRARGVDELRDRLISWAQHRSVLPLSCRTRRSRACRRTLVLGRRAGEGAADECPGQPPARPPPVPAAVCPQSIRGRARHPREHPHRRGRSGCLHRAYSRAATLGGVLRRPHRGAGPGDQPGLRRRDPGHRLRLVRGTRDRPSHRCSAYGVARRLPAARHR